MKLILRAVKIIDQAKTAASAKEDRLAHGLSLKELAARFDPPISVAYLSKLETGTRNWDPELVEMFNRAIRKE